MLDYRGGKKRVSKFIIDNLPSAELFIDVFGGSAAVSIEAVKSGKYSQVIYNDLDSNLVNFMKVVRDSPVEFANYLIQTPVGRYLHNEIIDMLSSDNSIVQAAGVVFCV